MKKILYFSDCYIYGGSERVIINIMNSIAEQKDYEVFFCYRYYKDYQRGVERDVSSRVKLLPLFLFSNDTFFHRINSKVHNYLLKKIVKAPFWLIHKIGLYTIFNYFLVRKVILKIKPDLIHINNGGYPASFNCQVALFAARHCGIKKILYHINNPAQKRKGLIYKIIDMKINNYTTFFITASLESVKSLSKRRGFDPDKVIQIYNTVEKHVPSMSRQEIMNLHNVKEHNKFILCQVAFLTERKGQIYVLEALKRIRELYPNIFSDLLLFLVGDGEDFFKLKNFCRSNHLDNVIFTGYKKNYIDYISCADIFLMPSVRGEDMPLAVLKAMSLGKPIIASDIAGISEEIENNVSGFLIKPENLENLHIEIIKLYSDPELRNHYGSNAIRRFETLFSPQIIYKKISSLYREIFCEG